MKDENEVKVSRKPIQSRGRMMDFAPIRNTNVPKVERKETDAEKERHEIARQQARRREEIHRQIELQNEADLLRRRKEETARRELALKRAAEEEAERARAEKEAVEAERHRREMAMRQKKLREENASAARRAEERAERIAKRRAEIAKKELAERQSFSLRRKKAKKVVNPHESMDPIAHGTEPEPKRKHPKIDLDLSKSRGTPVVRYGAISAKTGRVITKAEEEYKALHPEVMGDIDNFASEVDLATDDKPEKKQVQPVEMRSSYVPGDRSAFINIDPEKKREAKEAVKEIRQPGFRLSENSEKKMLGGPGYHNYVSPAEYPSVFLDSSSSRNDEFDLTEDSNGNIKDTAPLPKSAKRSRANGRYVPYEEPIPHKNLYARRLEAMKDEKDVPTVVVAKDEKESSTALIVVIIITILLGVGIGVAAYMAFFK